jgi:hypothetical protein
VLQQQLQRLRELKSTYEDLHRNLINHVSALNKEDHSEPPNKRQKIASVELGAENQDRTAPCAGASELAAPATAAPSPTEAHATAPNTDAGTSRNKDTATELLSAYERHSGTLVATSRLEQNAASALSLDLDGWDACAVITGRKSRYYLHQTTVSVGRSSILKGQV